MKHLVGKILETSFINVVSDRINRVFLQIDGAWYVICGKKGSEILSFNPCDDPITLGIELRRMVMISQFEGLKIAFVEQIGLKRCGYQIGFDKIYDQGLVIQSIYDEKPSEFDGYLRVGVVNYIYKI